MSAEYQIDQKCWKLAKKLESSSSWNMIEMLKVQQENRKREVVAFEWNVKSWATKVQIGKLLEYEWNIESWASKVGIVKMLKYEASPET